MKNDVTIVLVSFYSEKIILKYVKKLSGFKIIIVENSKNFFLKKKLKNEKNIKVFVSKKNLGFGASINFAKKKISTKFLLHLDLDTNLNKIHLMRLVKFARSNNNFGILTGKIRGFKYRIDQFNKKNIYNNCDQMKYVDGCLMLFNLKYFNKKIFDENFFLYFEETDLFKRCEKKNIKIIKLNTVNFFHKGRSSSENKYNNEIEINRNWHYMWSKFYYNKKHYGYFLALTKSLRNFTSSFIKGYILWFLNYKKKDIYKARFSGCLNSILLKKSSFRPNIK